MKLERYTDFSFQSDPDDSKSISRYVFILNGKGVSWKSFKQQTVANLTTDAEYITTSEAAKEVVRMKKCIIELGVISEIEGSVPLYYDNTQTVIQAKKSRSHQRSKYVLKCFHLIREIIERQDYYPWMSWHKE